MLLFFKSRNLIVGLLSVFLGSCGCSYRDIGLVRALLYPEQANMAGKLGPDSAGKSFDHSRFNRILNQYVDARGFVNYGELRKSAIPELELYFSELNSQNPEVLTKYNRLAFYINAYNAFTLKLMVDHPGVASIKKIPKAWDLKHWNLGGKKMSLNHLEHEIIRKEFAEPRIHFVLVCAAKSCPPLWNEAYRGKNLPEQLQERACSFMKQPHGYRRVGNVIYLTELLDWYKGDFVSHSGSVLEYLKGIVPAAEKSYIEGNQASIKIKYTPYDWSLNGSW